MVRVDSWIVVEMRKEGFIAGRVIIIGRIIYWVILDAVELRVAKRFCTSSRTW